jgi:hypothetical protein
MDEETRNSFDSDSEQTQPSGFQKALGDEQQPQTPPVVPATPDLSSGLEPESQTQPTAPAEPAHVDLETDVSSAEGEGAGQDVVRKYGALADTDMSPKERTDMALNGADIAKGLHTEAPAEEAATSASSYPAEAPQQEQTQTPSISEVLNPEQSQSEDQSQGQYPPEQQ